MFVGGAPPPLVCLNSLSSEARCSFTSLPGTDAVAINQLLPNRRASCSQADILMTGATLAYTLVTIKEQYRLECN